MTNKPLVQSNDDLISDYWKGKEEREKKQLNSTEVFKQYCENDPGALECRIYDV
jgi:hypothetical protein